MRQLSYLAMLFEGSSASMFQVANGEAHMVLTSPPYFDNATDTLLRQPLRAQIDVDQVWRELTAFAAKLLPNFEEVCRILRPKGVLVLQTKDIPFGELLLPLANIHTELVRNVGLLFRTRIDWMATSTNPARRPACEKRPSVGIFRAHDKEQFLVISRGTFQHSLQLSDNSSETLESAWIEPLWRTKPACGARHPHSSPPDVVQRFLKLHTRSGDLVVEPFCGHDTTLIEAARFGRRCIGYEIGHCCVERTLERLK